MDVYGEIQDKIDSRKFEKILNSKTSGCISSGEGFHTDDKDIFVKINTKEDAFAMFYGEMVSLKNIRQTNTIYAPEPICIVEDPQSDGGAFVMEYLNMNRVTHWDLMGSFIADLHLFNSTLYKKKEKLKSWIGKPPESIIPCVEETFEKEIKLKISNEVTNEVEYIDQFGFETSTFCGNIPQNNEWHDNWIEFYARNKLNLQVNQIIEEVGDRKIIEYWSILQLKIDKFFKDLTRPIVPSLLHGDLWSGNVCQVDEKPVIFDPASFYGHAEFDLSISILFGGFGKKFYTEYFRKIPKEKGFEIRNDLYTLFHTLNHWNHFGTHQEQTKQIMEKLVNY